ncbi:hypothetical protein [Streptomyces indiaensis]|uniref:Uncharacterized protein n=1 Tax=Streptomyces indiaensis TaxID=284033 RepID=A0ABP5Q7X6_9ACTN|nr:hypothetical protein [Streptomyces indiaensis]MCF1646539.1 hypothetical protein [Streptomyces indiaensis]
MASLSKAGAALTALREELTGDVLVPGDPGYDEARAVFSATASTARTASARLASRGPERSLRRRHHLCPTGSP